MNKLSKAERKKADREARRTRGVVNGMERDRHFAAGGTPVTWNGGRMWTAADKRAVSSKTACRRGNW